MKDYHLMNCSKKFNILDGIVLTKFVCDDISEDRIKNCFNKAFLYSPSIPHINDFCKEETINFGDDDLLDLINEVVCDNVEVIDD